MKHVVSFSGGRTSAYLCHLMIEKFGRENVDFVFMDTGAEHPKTYEFIKKCVEHFRIELTCLQGDFEQPIGVGHSYKVVPIESLRHDMIGGPFGRLMAKYGVPTVASAWCTSRMKEETHDKYCNDKYGKGNYITWIGIRADEPNRVLGEKIGREWRNRGLDAYQLTITLQHAVKQKPVVCGIDDIYSDIKKRMAALDVKKIKYMAEITDAEKYDVLYWWERMPFNLEIDEHLGNCVFCFKKSINKVALAARDEPELAAHFIDAISKANNRLSEPKEKIVYAVDRGELGPNGESEWIEKTNRKPKGVMFRSGNSLQSIIAKFALHTRDEIHDTIRSMKRNDSGSCSESCEAFGQIDLFEELDK